MIHAEQLMNYNQEAFRQLAIAGVPVKVLRTQSYGVANPGSFVLMIEGADGTAGLIHRVAGTGRQGHSGDGGDPLKATFNGPRGLTVGLTGVLYVPDGENNVIRAIDT